MTRIYNRTSEKSNRRELCRQMPRAEVVLWSRLRRRQILGYKFRRQYSVGPYVLDFYCSEIKLAIEIDGDSHFGDGAEVRDAKRQLYIKSMGIEFLRFNNIYVFKNLDEVVDMIAETIINMKNNNPPQSPLVKGGRRRVTEQKSTKP
ncbi:MAG: DUF559 domain-containing protein [Planctomycetota bacterium]|nr:MAG: DUF559 domain-containing protein [Planctomycetota bacterium]